MAIDRVSDPSSTEMKSIRASESPVPTKSKFHRGKKKVHNISKSMIKRVEGGGVGLVNPMGWYDAERADTPSPSPAQPSHPSESTRVDTDDEAIADDDDEEEELPRGRLVKSPEAMPSLLAASTSTEQGRRRPTLPTITIPSIMTGEHGNAQVIESPVDE